MFLGIEIGGTKLQLGVGSGDGPPLVALERFDVDAAAGAESILDRIRQAAPPLIARHGVKAVGFGFGGPVDMLAGRAVKSHQVAGWDDFLLAHWCHQTLSLSAAVGNDCDVAALAEARFGAGRELDPVFYVTVGTGVGGGLVIGGRIYRGSGAGAAEIGHLRLVHGDEHWPLESVCSGPGIDAAAKAELLTRSAADADADDLRRLVTRDLDQLTAQMVAEAAAAGNALARRVFQSAVRTLGWGVAQVITLVAPAVVVVGGGVSLATEELFLAPLRRAVEEYVFPPFHGTYSIVPAALGEESVVHGAVALAAQETYGIAGQVPGVHR
jgi:glucokinase